MVTHLIGSSQPFYGSPHGQAKYRSPFFLLFFPLCRQASPPGVSGRNAPLVEELSNIPIFTAFSSSDKTKIAVLLSKLSLSLKGQHSA